MPPCVTALMWSRRGVQTHRHPGLTATTGAEQHASLVGLDETAPVILAAGHFEVHKLGGGDQAHFTARAEWLALVRLRRGRARTRHLRRLGGSFHDFFGRHGRCCGHGIFLVLDIYSDGATSAEEAISDCVVRGPHVMWTSRTVLPSRSPLTPETMISSPLSVPWR